MFVFCPQFTDEQCEASAPAEICSSKPESFLLTNQSFHASPSIFAQPTISLSSSRHIISASDHANRALTAPPSTHDHADTLASLDVVTTQRKSLSPQVFKDAPPPYMDSNRLRKSKSHEMLDQEFEMEKQVSLKPSPMSRQTDKPHATSEVQRKKKMKSMKQKVKRSASASRVEDIMSPAMTSGNSYPGVPALSQSRESSEESIDEARKMIILQKVEELKRIRDLAKAYADGEFFEIPCNPTHEQLVMPTLDNSSYQRAEMLQPEKTQAPSRTPPAPVSPAASRRKPVAMEETVVPSQNASHLVLPQPKSIDQAAVPRQKKSKRRSKTDPMVVPGNSDRYAHPNLSAQNQERPAQSSRSKQKKPSRAQVYNSYPTNDEELPKFPVLVASANSSGTLYDNMRGQESYDSMGNSVIKSSHDSSRPIGHPDQQLGKVNVALGDLVHKLNCGTAFWNRDVHDPPQFDLAEDFGSLLSRAEHPFSSNQHGSESYSSGSAGSGLDTSIKCLHGLIMQKHADFIPLVTMPSPITCTPPVSNDIPHSDGTDDHAGQNEPEAKNKNKTFVSTFTKCPQSYQLRHADGDPIIATNPSSSSSSCFIPSCHTNTAPLAHSTTDSLDEDQPCVVVSHPSPSPVWPVSHPVTCHPARTLPSTSSIPI